jgi:hypothetical protein
MIKVSAIGLMLRRLAPANNLTPFHYVQAA